MAGQIPIINGGTGAETAAAARFSLGVNINSNRSYSSQSLSFSTPRKPNVDNDTFVIVSTQMILTAIQSSTITIQIDPGNGFVTIATISSSGIAITKDDIVSFIVPANAQYQIVSTGTGTNSIVSVFELTL